MIQSNYILHKTQKAIADWLKTQVPINDVSNVYAGLRTGERVIPCVICCCLCASADVQPANTWLAGATVQLRSDSDNTTEAQHHDRVEALFNLIATDTFAASITAQLDHFTCFLSQLTDQRFAVEDPHFVSEVDVRLMVCGSDIG